MQPTAVFASSSVWLCVALRCCDDCYTSKFLSEPLLPDGAVNVTSSLPPFLSNAACHTTTVPAAPMPPCCAVLCCADGVLLFLVCVCWLLSSRRLYILRPAAIPSAAVLAAPIARCQHCRLPLLLRAFASSTTIAAAPSLVSSVPRRCASGGSSAAGGGFLSGLSARLSGVVDARQAVAADNQFSATVGDMLAVSKYTLSDHVRFMERTAADAGVSGWKSYMPGVSSQAGVEELKRMLAILRSFTAAEQSDVALVGRDARLRVATATGRTVADVNFVLRQYGGAVLVHQWLHSRKSRGLPLPTTQSELSNMMAIDKPPQARQMVHKPRRR